MGFCSHCGKERDEESKFCSYCGREVLDSSKSYSATESQTSFNVIMIGLLIGIIIIGTAFIISNRSATSNTDNTDILLPEEQTIAYIEEPTETIAPITRKEGFSINDKPFDNRHYAYDERNPDFRLVCADPCPVSKEILDQEFAAIQYSVSTLRGLTQSDIDEDLMPFEVHATEDDRCPLNENGIAYQAYMRDDNGYHRGKLCFFYEKFQYNRAKFPYSTSSHEVVHLFQARKFPPYVDGGKVLTEGIAEVVDSFFLRGSDQDSFCSAGYHGAKYTGEPHNDGRLLFTNLCLQYGFDYDDLPELFDKLEEKEGNLDVQDFVNIINGIVGADTAHLFKEAGVI